MRRALVWLVLVLLTACGGPSDDELSAIIKERVASIILHELETQRGHATAMTLASAVGQIRIVNIKTEGLKKTSAGTYVGEIGYDVLDGRPDKRNQHITRSRVDVVLAEVDGAWVLQGFKEHQTPPP
jgi:hypothetical protein